MQAKFIKIFLALIFISQFAYAQNGDYRNVGENLERGLFKTVADKNWQALETMTAPEFQSVNSDKIRNRSDGLSYIKSLQFKDYNLYDFSVTQSQDGNILVVTYEVTYAEKVGERPQAGKKIKNLSVWKKVNGQWQWVAHAVLDC